MADSKPNVRVVYNLALGTVTEVPIEPVKKPAHTKKHSKKKKKKSHSIPVQSVAVQSVAVQPSGQLYPCSPPAASTLSSAKDLIAALTSEDFSVFRSLLMIAPPRRDGPCSPLFRDAAATTTVTAGDGSGCQLCGSGATVRLMVCQHSVCRACLTAAWQALPRGVDEAVERASSASDVRTALAALLDQLWVACPVPSCGMQAFQAELAAVLGDEAFARLCRRGGAALATFVQQHGGAGARLTGVEDVTPQRWLAALLPVCMFCGAGDHALASRCCRLVYPYLLHCLVAKLERLASDLDTAKHTADALSAALLRAITLLLPNTNVNVCFHELVPPVLSQLLPYFRALLATDSFFTISQRCAVYDAAFNLLNKLSHPLLVGLLHAADLATPLAALATQAAVFRSTAADATDNESDVHLANTVQQIAALVQQRLADYANKSLDQLSSPASSSSSSSTSTAPEAGHLYVSTMRPLLFGEATIDYASHRYNDRIVISSATPSSKARLSRIAREIATLSTSLPLDDSGGVFLRVDDRRIDVMTACIIGPADTPYERGAFIFDIFLPPSYPQQPPKVWLMTTGHGRVRFNPNLYSNGKVCLSLLGTWAGPGWDPQSSTVLQVLLSIRALIMVPEPWYNEPGREGSRSVSSVKSSHKYNAKKRGQTVQWAMQEQLRRPHPIFGPVIREHFRLQKQVMLHDNRTDTYWRDEITRLDV